MPVLLKEILDLIAPEALRDRCREFHESREQFEPRILTTSSYDEMMEELGRFVGMVQQRWFHAPFPWPKDRAEQTARRLLNKSLGDNLHPKSGEFKAAQLCRHGDQGGMRTVLDALADSLLEEALVQYLDCQVLPMIYELDPQSSLRLAESYLERYPEQPEHYRENPASIALRWRQVIHRHARLCLGS